MKNLIILSLIIISIPLSAQYNQSIGLRGGARGTGLTYNFHIGAKPFLQFDAIGVNSQELQGGIILASINSREEIHASTLNTTRLIWSYGAGIHAGYYKDPNNTTNESDLAIGPDFRLASEFQFKLPIVIGVDVMGYYNLLPLLKPNHNKGWLDNYLDFGVYLKYVIN
tara:strand:+ start:143 stop:646 length:504 start_codon:yes stop_codon:yes gene_type:complete